MRASYFVLFFILATSSSAYAQEPQVESEDSSLEEARAHHLRGVEALEGNDLQTAEREFSAALAITFRASTAYNLALVLTEQARATEALALYARVLALGDDELPRARRDIEFDRDRATRIQAHVELALAGVESAELRVDGVPDGRIDAGSTRTLDLDPGEHRIDAESGDLRVAETLRLSAGDSRVVRLTFAPPASNPVDLIPRPREGDEEPTSRRRRRRRLAGWLIGGALVVAAAVVVGVVLHDPKPTGGIEEPPFGSFDASYIGAAFR